MARRREAAPALPAILLGERPTVKLLWAWLAPQGIVSYSVRQLSAALGIAPSNVHHALARLRELELLEDLDGPKPRRKGRYRARGDG